MTRSRLYYTDCYGTEFDAAVLELSPDGRCVVLDQSLFYPTSGGQPHDTGQIAGIPVLEVSENEHQQVVHHLASGLSPDTSVVHGKLDWERRYDHMQQHTGQHLLSAVLLELFQCQTLSFHIGAQLSTIELSTPTLTDARIEQAEHRLAQLVAEARPIQILFERAEEAPMLRKASERQGEIRIVNIQGVDRSACGGTHLRTTAEVGLLQIRNQEKVRGHARIGFVCGYRALARGRADYQLLSVLARDAGTSFDQLPQWWSKQRTRLAEAERDRQRLALGLAALQAREVYRKIEPRPDDLRALVRRVDRLDDSARAFATAFTDQPKAVILLTTLHPPSVLLAVSDDSGWHAGQRLRAALERFGGRGGGSARLAQATVPEDKLTPLADSLFSAPGAQ